MSKHIDEDYLFKLHKIIIVLSNIIKKYYMFFIIFILFIIVYRFAYLAISTDYFFDSFIRKQGISNRCFTLQDNNETINRIDTLFKEKHNQNIININFLNIPKSLSNYPDIEVSKEVYINMLLPLILKIEENIKEERAKILDIKNKIISSPLIDEDIELLEKLANKYKVMILETNFWDYAKAIDELVEKVDIIPRSLLLAIIIEDTKWGSSNNLQNKNNLFLIRNINTRGLFDISFRSNKDSPKYVSLESSLIRWYINFNSNNMYERVRFLRSRLQRLNLSTSNISIMMARELDRYNMLGGEKLLVNTIQDNFLQQYNRDLSFDKNYKYTCLRLR